MKLIKQNLCTLIFISLSLASGCSQQSKTETNSTNLYWETSNPQTEGIDPLVLDSIHQDIENGKYGLIDHFLVIRNDKIVYDKEYSQDYKAISKNYDTTRHQYNYDHPDWHPFYNSTPLHSIQSVSKSVTSLLLGIAVDQGHIISLDSLIYPHFDEYQFDLSDERKKSITIRNLLTMQSGIQWDEISDYADNQENNCTIMELSDDWIQYVLDRPMDTIPGTKFVYNSGVTVLLGKIVRNATGKRIDKWAEEKLFNPLGITEYYWKETHRGEIDAEGGLYLSVYDLAKIGYLVLNKGIWEGQQIISKKWIEESIRPSVEFDERSGYGFQWWVPRHTDRQTEVFAGRGYGGQYLIAEPGKNLLVVFTGWNIHDNAEKSSFLALRDRIAPNMKD